MTKTALQQAFSRLEELYPDLFNIHSERGRTFVNEFHQFLGVEKDQLKHAYNSDRPNLCAFTEGTAFKEYYNETYKNK